MLCSHQVYGLDDTHRLISDACASHLATPGMEDHCDHAAGKGLPGPP
jgi:hypothetical protein